MPEISEDQFQTLAEIQALSRTMKRCGSVREPEFAAAQNALTMALNRLASLPTIRDRAEPSGRGIEA
jgi:hypothetical protein